MAAAPDVVFQTITGRVGEWWSPDHTFSGRSSNLTIEAVLVTGPGASSVPTLPDGTPSVQIAPLGPICFGTVPPCRDDVAGCVSREFVIRTRGARPGDYEVHLLGVCYDVVFHYDMRDSFKLVLCKD